eukprot:jgi/Undpi1/5488/HiC_scaffold_2.g00767.m1
MEVRRRQDAKKSVCIKRRHGAMSAGEVLEEESFVCYVKAVALIGLRGRGRGGKRRRGERSLVAAALSKIGAGVALLVREVGVALLLCFYSGRRDAEAVGVTAVAQPYNGPVAQEAVASQVGNQQQTHVVVVRHGGPGRAVQQQPHSHCCLAWVSCLFCCPLIGLFAIFNSWSVRQKWARNDFDGAYRASEMAKKAALAAIILGLAWEIATAIYTSSDSDDNNEGSFSPSPTP